MINYREKRNIKRNSGSGLTNNVFENNFCKILNNVFKKKYVKFCL